MKRSQQQYLLDILEAMENAERFAGDLEQQEDLKDDLRTRYALERAFEIIGEATKQLSPALRKQHPEVPWRDMAGMRDMLIHQYASVNLAIVWQTVHEDLAHVKPLVRRVLDDLTTDE